MLEAHVVVVVQGELGMDCITGPAYIHVGQWLPTTYRHDDVIVYKYVCALNTPPRCVYSSGRSEQCAMCVAQNLQRSAIQLQHGIYHA